jgi:hypothetical protein
MVINETGQHLMKFHNKILEFYSLISLTFAFVDLKSLLLNFGLTRTGSKF